MQSDLLVIMILIVVYFVVIVLIVWSSFLQALLFLRSITSPLSLPPQRLTGEKNFDLSLAQDLTTRWCCRGLKHQKRQQQQQLIANSDVQPSGLAATSVAVTQPLAAR